jgi:hypothetical protein
MIMAAVAESNNEEDPYEADSKEDCDVYESTYALTSKVDSSILKYPHLTETT